MRKNKELLEKRFSKHPSPVMFGVVNALFNDSPSGCVLLGQRNIDQVLIAASLGDLIKDEDSTWVNSLYQKQHILFNFYLVGLADHSKSKTQHVFYNRQIVTTLSNALPRLQK